MKNKSLFFLTALLAVSCAQAPSSEESAEPRVMARFVPERADDFVFENEQIAGRIYGQALEAEMVSPGIDIWVKIPGELIANDMYSGKLSYHKFNGKGKDCYKVGVTLGAGASAVVLDDKLIFPATNYRSYEILENTNDKVVFVLHYPEWEVDGEKIALDKKLTVTSGTRFVRVDDTYTFSGPRGKKLTVAAGVNRHIALDTVQDEYFGSDRYILWEKASDTSAEPEEGMIGVAVYVPGAKNACLSADQTHGIVSKTIRSGKPFTYYFGNCWSRGGVETSEEWFSLVKSLK